MSHPENLGLRTALSMVVGTVIGSGIFMVSADVARAVPSPGGALLVWLVAGVMSLLGCLIFCELGTLFPSSGGQYVYLYESFGPLIAYLYGWTLIAVIQSGSIAAVASVFAQFAVGFWGPGNFSPKMIGAAVIIGFTGLNMCGLRKATTVLDFLTDLKTVALILIPGTIFFFFYKGSFLPPKESLESSPITTAGFGVGLIAAFWAYDGWNGLGYIAGDIRNPRKNLPLATLGGISLVTFLYLLVNWSYQKVLTTSEISVSSNVASQAMTIVLGHFGGRGISVVILISTLATANALIIAGSRIIRAMALRGGLPPALALTSPKSNVPANAFLVQMVWSLCLLWSGKFDQIYTCVIGVSFFFYGLTAVGLIFLKRTKGPKSIAFRVPLHPLVPVLYIIFCIFFIANTVAEKPRESLVGLGLMLLGIPFYSLAKTRFKPEVENYVG